MFFPFERLQLLSGRLDIEHSHSAEGFPHIFAVFFFRLKTLERLSLFCCLLSPECQGLNWVTIRSDRFNKKKREDHVFRRSLVSGSMISLKTCRTKKVKGGLACFQ